MDSVIPLVSPHYEMVQTNVCPILFASFVPCSNVSLGAQNTLAPFFELVSQIISYVVLDRMLSRHLKTQHAQMNHGLQSIKQFASTKVYIDQYYVLPYNQIDCLWFQGKERC